MTKAESFSIYDDSPQIRKAVWLLVKTQPLINWLFGICKPQKSTAADYIDKASVPLWTILCLLAAEKHQFPLLFVIQAWNTLNQ